MSGLREEIINIIYDEPLSISEIYRRLSARGVKINRLVLTGYLRAMEEMGEIEYVKNKNSKNAKRYIYKKKRNIYQRIGDILKRMDVKEEKKREICLYILHKIFNRPVFKTEIRLCGFVPPNNSIKVTGEDRKKAYVMASKKLELRPREYAYLPSEEYVEEYRNVISQLIEELEKEGCL